MSNNPLIRLTDSDNGGYSAIGGEGGNLYLYTNSSSRDFIFRGSNEVARLTGDGYFGIGVNATNPGYNIVSHIGSNTAYSGSATNNTALAIGNVNSSANTNSVGIYMYSDGNGRGVVGLNCLSNSTGSSADFTIQTRHSGTLGERLRITSTGHLLRGGTGQNIGASNARWATGYFTDIDATNLTGTISAPGSDTQVLFNSNGDVAADAGLTFNSGTDKLTVGGDIKLGGSGSGGTLFFDEAAGGVEKIKQSGGSLELYADGAIKFIESDNDKLMFTFDVNTTYDDARIIMEGDTDTYFNHPASNQLGFTLAGNDTLRLKAGQVGISTSTLRGKLDIDTGTEQNSDVEYYGQDFGLVIKHQSGSGANEEGNGICFVQKWYNQSGELVRTGAIVGYKQSANGSFGGGLIFKTQQNGASPLGEVLRLTQDGKVGIGTYTLGSQKLDVYVDSTSDAGIMQLTQDGTGDAAIDFQIKGIREYSLGIDNSDSDKFKLSGSAGLGNNTLLTVTNGGKVGINETTPDWALHITEGSENARIKIERTSTSGVAGVIFKNTIQEHHIQTNNSNFDIYDSTNTSTRVRIKNNGSINIGGDYDQTTDKLQVTGNGKINGDLTVTGTINATVTGTAENATNINVAADNSTNATHYPIFVGGATGNQRPNSDTGLTYNPSSGNLSARNFFAILDGGSNTNSQQIVAGDSHGSVALTVNDGYGNANVAFNHRNGVPDGNGSSGRIWCAGG